MSKNTIYRNISCPEDSDCAVHAIRKAFENININIPGSVQDTRKEICQVTRKFFPLSQLSGKTQTKNDEIITCYKNIFNNDLDLFKQVVLLSLTHHPNSVPLYNAIDSTNTWNDIKVASKIFANCSTFGVDLEAILQDHKLVNQTTSTQYYNKASKSGVWLNNSEISAYLLTKGFLFASCEVIGTKTYIKYHNSENKKIYLCNNGTSKNLSSKSKGSHWEAATKHTVIEKYNEDHTNEDSSSNESNIYSGNSEFSSTTLSTNTNSEEESDSTKKSLNSPPIDLLKSILEPVPARATNILESETTPISETDENLEKITFNHKTIQENISKVKASIQASYFLTSLGTILLRSELVEKECKKIKDPLKFKIENLKKQLFEKTLALNFIQNTLDIQLSSDYNNESDLILLKREYEAAISSISKEKEIVTQLKDYKDKSHSDFQGLFPYIPKKISPTFHEKYNKIFHSGQPQDKNTVVKELLEIRRIINNKNLKDGQFEYHGKFIQIEKFSPLFKFQKKKDLIAKIGDIVGKEHTEKDQTIINKSIKIYNHLREASKYTTDPDYLRNIEKLSIEENHKFLVQIRIYKQLGRDMIKIASLFTGGIEDIIISLPPGNNTTLKITSSGSANYFVGEFGSYKNIGKLNLQTLKNYSSFLSFQQPDPNKKIYEDTIEKEKEFRHLYQVECIRNTSALLTNAMFFELADAKFQTTRTIGVAQQREAEIMLAKAKKSKKDKKAKDSAIESANKKLTIIKENQGKQEKEYNLSEIADQMPMAMKGAVSGTVELEHKFFNYLPGQLKYDYRAEGNKANKKILANRDHNILFDWLCHKLNSQGLPLSFTNSKIQKVKNYTLKKEEDNYILEKDSYIIVYSPILGKNIEEKIQSELPQKFRKVQNQEALSLKNDKGKEKFYSYTIEPAGKTKDGNNKFIIKNEKNEPAAEFKAVYKARGQYEFNIIKYCKFIISEIQKFPLSIFNDLTNKWYGMKLFEEQKDLFFSLLLSSTQENLSTKENLTGKGIGQYNQENPWMEYTKEGMDELLKLRLEAADQSYVKTIMPNYVYDGTEESPTRLANEISNSLEEKTLVVLNLYGRHWVGLVIEKGSEVIDINYMDSEQEEMPALLQEKLISQINQTYPTHIVQLMQPKVEPQRYNNCGPEVIENLTSLLFGVGTRTTSQEDAVAIQSALLENSLTNHPVSHRNSLMPSWPTGEGLLSNLSSLQLLPGNGSGLLSLENAHD
jgi:hypothetical protein